MPDIPTSISKEDGTAGFVGLLSIASVDSKTLRGKHVLVRVDWNVPMEEGSVADASRIERSLPTIRLLQTAGAKVILISHIGRDPHESLAPVAAAARERFGLELAFCEADPASADANEAISRLGEGEILLLENLRRDGGEQAGEMLFAQRLAALADIYVNEAFPVSHREAASVTLTPKLMPAYAGINFLREVEHLSLFERAERPFLFVLGGAKFETKLPLVKKFLSRADTLFAGGALLNDLLKAEGCEVGRSIVSSEPVDLSGVVGHPHLLKAPDVLVETAGGGVEARPSDAIAPEERAVDVGSATLERLVEAARAAKFILWNGPLGIYEEGFSAATHAFAEAVAQGGATSIVGGGDTVAAIASLGLEDKFTFLSTAGGAMLEFLEKGTLPGIEALLSSGART